VVCTGMTSQRRVARMRRCVYDEQKIVVDILTEKLILGILLLAATLTAVLPTVYPTSNLV